MKSKPKGRGIQSQWWKMPFSRGFLKKLDDIQTRVPPIPPALGSGEYKSCPPYYGKSLQGTFGAAGKETTALTVPCPQKAATKTPDRQGQMIFSCFFTWVLAHQLPPEQGMEALWVHTSQPYSPPVLRSIFAHGKQMPPHLDTTGQPQQLLKGRQTTCAGKQASVLTSPPKYHVV